MTLFKTTIVIWTDYDPGEQELADLAIEATSGNAYCSKQEVTEVTDVFADPDYVDVEFFDMLAELHNIDDNDAAAE